MTKEKSRSRLETIPPTMSLEELDRLQFFAPKGLQPDDLDEALREERKDRFDYLNPWRNENCGAAPLVRTGPPGPVLPPRKSN